MNNGKTIFSQLMDFIPAYEFQKCVKRYRGDYKVKTFSCWDQFLCLAFAQLTYRESLRDIEACLRSAQGKLYHLGIRGKVSRNTLANANYARDYRIYADLAGWLIAEARKLYANDNFGLELKQTAYALDSTTIDLCLALFPWAKFRKRKGALKIHTLLDIHGSIPSLIWITPGKVHDVNILDELSVETGAIYIMDRGYLDFSRLHTLHQKLAFFITRAKKNFRFIRLYSKPVDKTTGVIFDQIIVLKCSNTAKNYPDKIRRIGFIDKENNNKYIFLTNNFTLPTLTIANLYKHRWRIELFFKWIKQHLRIKAFYGNSENAVKTQIWIAISVYVLVALVKKKMNLQQNLYTILQILSVTLFEKTPITQALSLLDYKTHYDNIHNQLFLFK